MRNHVFNRNGMILLAVLTGLLAGFLAAAAEDCFAAAQVKYLDAAGVEKTRDGCVSVASVPDAPYPTLGGSDGNAKWYVLDRDVTYSNYRLTVLGSVHLILADGCTLNAAHGIRMATNRPEGASLTIYAQSTGAQKGVLVANASGDDSCAGIGGNDSEWGGVITINGGDVTASGGKCAAGIGGGEDRGGNGITINNGTVHATGGAYGAGIGGGEGGSGGRIDILGGTVTAIGGYRAAGIGGGQKWHGGGDGGAITIRKATVTATAGNDGAGIGGGQDGEGGTITIDSGEVKAMGGDDGRGAGIGGGVDAHAGTITINGGKVQAFGGIGKTDTYGEDGGGAGIGAGYDNDNGEESRTAGGHVIINGGNIKAVGGYMTRFNRDANWGGAGIGSGTKGYGLRIEIHGGTIDAMSPDHDGASIGGGDDASGGHISIDDQVSDPVITTETGRGCVRYVDTRYCIGNGREYDGDYPAVVDFDYPDGKVWVWSDVIGYDMYEKFLDKGDRARHIGMGNGHYRSIKIMPCDHPGKKAAAADGGHRFDCRYCSAFDGTVSPHEYKANVWNHNDTEHWRTCTVCGAAFEREAHAPGEAGKCACGFNYSFQISKGALELEEGGTDESIRVTASAAIPDDQIAWTSSSETVAEAQGNGRSVTIKAGKEGTAVITAAGAGLTASCTVTVKHVHRMTEVQASKQPTCTEDGARAFYWCDDEDYGCNRTFFDEEGLDEFNIRVIDPVELIIPAAGHQGEWKLVREATQSETGLIKRVCEICEEEQTVTTPKANAGALLEMLERAEEAKEGVVVSKNGSEIAPSAKWAKAEDFAALQTAADQAKAVRDDRNATQKQLNDAEAEFSAAVQAFEAAVRNGTKGTVVYKGPRFAPLMLTSPKQTKKSIRLQWKKAPGAAKYVIYANRCGKKLKKAATRKAAARSCTVKKAAGKKLRKAAYYQFVVAALNKSGKLVAKSRPVYVATAGSKKKANPKKVIVKAKVSRTGAKLRTWKSTARIVLRAGNTPASLVKSTLLKATATKAKGSKVKQYARIRFESSNAGIVKVTAKGRVTAVKKGTAKIYAYAQNGVRKTVTVIVK